MNDDDLTTRLSHELQGRSDAMHGSSLALADVQQKARSIRRRRTATAVGGAALAVALIVPTAALANHHNGHTGPTRCRRRRASRRRPARRPARRPRTAISRQQGYSTCPTCSTGAAPRIEYVTGGDVLHQFDGSTVDLGTRYPVVGFVVLTDGTHVFETAGQGTIPVEVTGSDGTELGRRQIEGGLAVNPSHTIAAWVDPGGPGDDLDPRCPEASPLGDPVPGEDLRMGAVTGDDCSLACSVIVNVRRRDDPQPWEVTPDGAQPLTDGGYLSVDDVSQAGLTIGLPRSSRRAAARRCSAAASSRASRPATTPWCRSPPTDG